MHELSRDGVSCSVLTLLTALTALTALAALESAVSMAPASVRTRTPRHPLPPLPTTPLETSCSPLSLHLMAAPRRRRERERCCYCHRHGAVRPRGMQPAPGCSRMPTACISTRAQTHAAKQSTAGRWRRHHHHNTQACRGGWRQYCARGVKS